MSIHDPKATLHQVQDAARHAQAICAGKTLEELLNEWQAAAAGELPTRDFEEVLPL